MIKRWHQCSGLGSDRRQEPPGLEERYRPVRIDEDSPQLGAAQLDRGLMNQGLRARHIKQKCRSRDPARLALRPRQPALRVKREGILIEAMKRADHRLDHPA